MVRTETERGFTRGRPRPLETLRRDARVLKLVTKSPKTGNQLWDTLGQTEVVSRSQVWLSLDRLRRDGLVRLCRDRAGQQLWTADDSPCP